MISLLRADARALPLDDRSVDLIVTSPPYWGQRSYQDGGEHYTGQLGDEPTPGAYLDTLIEVTRECIRVLKPTGSLWVNLGDKYATRYASERPAGGAGLRSDGQARSRSGQNRTGVPEKSLLGLPWRYALRCIDDLGLILRAEVVWDKPNGLPESCTDRVRRSHEQWFHFTLQPRYYAAIDDVREPHAPVSIRRAEPHRADPGRRGPEVYGSTAREQTLRLEQMNHPLGRLPGSVWRVPSQPLNVPPELDVDHYAAFPMEFPRRLIRGWSPAGICVACGEGRRPVSDREVVFDKARDQAHAADIAARGAAHSVMSGGTARSTLNGRTTRIPTGEVCACNEPILSPTGSRAGDDPSMTTGRAGLNRPRADDEGRRPQTRHDQRHYAAQLRACTDEQRDLMRFEAGDAAYEHYVRTDRAGARPIPQPLLEEWTRRGLLTAPPPYVPAPTRPAVVLDVFGGTGTTALLADVLGRHGVSVDLGADYGRLARWRTTDPGERAAAMQVERPAAVAEGQDALF